MKNLFPFIAGPISYNPIFHPLPVDMSLLTPMLRSVVISFVWNIVNPARMTDDLLWYCWGKDIFIVEVIYVTTVTSELYCMPRVVVLPGKEWCDEEKGSTIRY